MGNRSRVKGRRGEQEVVKMARQHGLDATRTWALATHSDPAVRRCDVQVAHQPYQVKMAAEGFRRLYDIVQDVRGAFVREDQREWLAVIRAADYLRLLHTASHNNPIGGKASPVSNLQEATTAAIDAVAAEGGHRAEEE